MWHTVEILFCIGAEIDGKLKQTRVTAHQSLSLSLPWQFQVSAVVPIEATAMSVVDTGVMCSSLDSVREISER